MTQTVFTTGAFSSVIRAGDSKRFRLNLKYQRGTILSAAVAEISGGPVLEPFTTTRIKGRDCVSYDRFNDHLVLRSVSRHLQRRLRIPLPNRDRIVRGVIESLVDATPMFILRRDIKSFYESIPLSALRERLLYDTASSTRVRDVIRKYFDQHCGTADCGLPRGVGLSAILSELYMRGFDVRVREIPGVYKYYRFADDIVVFSSEAHSGVSSLLRTVAADFGFTFNPRKLQDIAIAGGAKASSNAEFEYLGYTFQVSSPDKRKEGRLLRVGISNAKITRLKTRVLLSLRAYMQDGDFGLLNDRLRFIAGNYRVRRAQQTAIATATHVRSGIFYNYRLSGIYKASEKGFTREDLAPEELKRLDGFYHSLRKSRRSTFAWRFRNQLTPDQQAQLARISFLAGFTKRMTVRLTPQRVGDLKAAWSHVA